MDINGLLQRMAGVLALSVALLGAAGCEKPAEVHWHESGQVSDPPEVAASDQRAGGRGGTANG